jgi:hypothetical protein
MFSTGFGKINKPVPMTIGFKCETLIDSGAGSMIAIDISSFLKKPD